MSYYVYLLTNYNSSVIYTGVTNDLQRRVYEHREKLADGFTKKYAVWKLVYYEIAEDIMAAIERDKQIKAGPRSRKVELIKRKTHSGETSTTICEGSRRKKERYCHCEGASPWQSFTAPCTISRCV